MFVHTTSNGTVRDDTTNGSPTGSTLGNIACAFLSQATNNPFARRCETTRSIGSTRTSLELWSAVEVPRAGIGTTCGKCTIGSFVETIGNVGIADMRAIPLPSTSDAVVPL